MQPSLLSIAYLLVLLPFFPFLLFPFYFPKNFNPLLTPPNHPSPSQISNFTLSNNRSSINLKQKASNMKQTSSNISLSSVNKSLPPGHNALPPSHNPFPPADKSFSPSHIWLPPAHNELPPTHISLTHSLNFLQNN